ncbi:hypothetical protein SAMN02745134_02831 [Clostridium acidisoli DSM 12555]|jgi:cellobiose-specific phosphotransferase system component IIC|uniref:Uncharacterized protein n=1 Tax=Clostridium acidisoli DSM 12555 TaxID=1121291 RepID=A0A1W1XRD7_9CLOT|nr:hypothetical protein SAMN02745134_02831 [Clostridium acidisoli DSM 12555]
MEIIEFLIKSLKGRGFYPAFMVVFSWTYTIVLIVVLICQLFLYIFRVKYYNPEFNNKEKIDKKR